MPNDMWSHGPGRSLEHVVDAAEAWSEFDRLIAKAGIRELIQHRSENPEARHSIDHIDRIYAALQGFLYEAIGLFRQKRRDNPALSDTDRERFRVHYSVGDDGSRVADNIPELYSRIEHEARSSLDTSQAEKVLLAFALCMVDIETGLETCRRAASETS